MSNLVYYRMLGYVVTIALHGGNIMYLSRPKPQEVLDDYRLKAFLGLSPRFLTGWTFFLQLVVSVAGLLCDLLTLWNSKKKDYRLPKYLRGFRDALFCGIVWPSVLIVFSFFWLIFLYDRSLVFPAYLDKVVHPVSNHIMHTAILPLALWEVYFQPRRQPRSHKKYMAHGLFHYCLYVSVLFYTYYERGIWIYPILKELYGTIYLPLMLASSAVIGIICYYTQWVLVYFIWGSSGNTKKMTKKHR